MAAIVLEWGQYGYFDTFDIVRSTTSLAGVADNDLPAPIATGLKTMYYVDTMITVGVLYYYKIKVNRAGSVVVSDQIEAMADVEPNWLFKLIPFNQTLRDDKSLLSIGGSGTVTDGYFQGQVNSPSNSAWDWYGRVGYIEFEVKGSGNICQDWGSNVRFQLYITGSTCYLKFYTSSPFGENTISFPLGNVASEFVKVRLTRNSNGTFSATVNGSNVTITGNSAFSFNIYAPYNTVPIGASTLMLKYLRYFKAV